MKNKLVFEQTYKKGAVADKQDVIKDIKNSKKIEIQKNGKYEDGTEFVVVKIYI